MKVLIADGAPLLRQRIAKLLRPIPGVFEVLEAENYTQMREVVQKEDPDVVLLDIFISGGNALKALTECFSSGHRGHVIVLMNQFDERLSAHCIALGADACYSKSEDLFDAIELIGKLAGVSTI